MKPKKTILCVDHNEQFLSIRKVILETRGYRVLATTSGVEAWELFKRGNVDLVLADLMLPDLDGATLIEKAKALSPSTPAILFSSKVKFCERETVANVFLPKGMCEPVELLERIRVLLIRKRGPRKAVLPAPAYAAKSAGQMTAAS